MTSQKPHKLSALALLCLPRVDTWIWEIAPGDHMLADKLAWVHSGEQEVLTLPRWKVTLDFKIVI